MKKIFVTLFVLFISTISIAQSKVGTIDVDFILSQMPEINTVQEEIKKYGESLDEQLQTKVNAYQEKLEDYNTNAASFTEEQVKEKQSAIFTLEEDISKFRQNGMQLMRIREDELKRPLYTKIAEALDVIAKEQNFTQILNTSSNANIVYLDPNFDVTLSVLKKMGIEVEE